MYSTVVDPLADDPLLASRKPPGTVAAVYVGNFHWWTTDKELLDLCASVVEVCVGIDAPRYVSLPLVTYRYSIVTYRFPSFALHNTVWHHCTLSLSRSVWWYSSAVCARLNTSGTRNVWHHYVSSRNVTHRYFSTRCICASPWLLQALPTVDAHSSPRDRRQWGSQNYSCGSTTVDYCTPRVVPEHGSSRNAQWYLRRTTFVKWRQYKLPACISSVCFHPCVPLARLFSPYTDVVPACL